MNNLGEEGGYYVVSWPALMTIISGCTTLIVGYTSTKTRPFLSIISVLPKLLANVMIENSE